MGSSFLPYFFMGKVDEGRTLPSADDGSEPSARNADSRCHGMRFIRFRCVVALLFSVAVFLSAVFWLPPFFHSSDQHDLDLNQRFRDHTIVASFEVKKHASTVEKQKQELTNDIFEEIGVIATKVVVISVEPAAAQNTAVVVFAVDPTGGNPEATITAQSLIRDVFESLVIHQLDLRLGATSPTLGAPFNFDVLKFPKGFTVTPPQSAFLLQNSHLLFAFDLRFSIDQIQYNFGQLRSQLISGLRLAPYENLYISLTNSEGSTVAVPTTVQSSVFLAVGGGTPSRLKQLALTISHSHKVNLGLNDTVFGSVNQVRLSSTIQDYLNGGEGNPPAPAPSPRRHHRRRRRRPENPPAAAPAPDRTRCHAPEPSSPPPSPSHQPPPSFFPEAPALPPAKRKREPAAAPAPVAALPPHSGVACSCLWCGPGGSAAIGAVLMALV